MLRKPLFDGWVKSDVPLEKFYPHLAAPKYNGTSGAAWTWSAYAEIVASTIADFVASWAHIAYKATDYVTATALIVFEVEFATGAAGAEVPFANVVCALGGVMVNPGTSTSILVGSSILAHIGPKLIPAGSRLAYRIRCNYVDTDAVINTGVYLGGYEYGKAPSMYPAYTFRARQAGIHKGQTKVIPAGGSLLSVTSGSLAWGSWVEMLASAPDNLLLWGMAGFGPVSVGSRWWILEFGIGPAGSEVPKARLAVPTHTYLDAEFQHLPNPLLVKKGQRLAVRAYAAGAYLYQMKFFYEEL